MGVGLLVTAWIARYLGPDQYGLWNYAIAFTALFSAFSTLGLDSIVVRELVKYPEKTNELLGTAFVLRLLGGLIAFSLSIITSILIGIRDFLTLSLIALSAGGFIFQAFLTIDYFYQAHIMSRYTVWAQNISFLIMSTVKIFLIFAHAPLLAFAVAGLIEIILGSAFLVGFYIYQTSKNISPLTSHVSLSHSPSPLLSPSHSLSPISSWRFSLPIAKSLLKDSWPLIIGSISALIYMRIDTIMVKQLLGNIDAGYYSAAQKISESFLFLTIIITQTLFPLISKYKKISTQLYYRRIYLLYSIIAKISFFLCLIVFLFSESIIKYLFGESYFNSVIVLKIYVWTSFFVFLSNASWAYYINENLQSLAMYRLVIGAIINVILNIILIKQYGLTGAAFSSIISYSISSYFFNIFSSKLITNFKLQTIAILNILNPFSYIKDFQQFWRYEKL
jgi:PST family polysaccharide transporter